MAVVRVTLDIEMANLRARSASNLAESIICTQAVGRLINKRKHVLSTPAKLFNSSGKIDKRRWSRKDRIERSKQRTVSIQIASPTSPIDTTSILNAINECANGSEFRIVNE